MEPSRKAQKDKKRKWQKEEQEKKNVDTSSTTRVNTMKTGSNPLNTGIKKKNKGRNNHYNYSKKGHFSRDCIKPKKDPKN